ncbi:MAG: hypothetical protein AB8B61_00470 [Cyclobacteriaceae bacterium]
MKKHLFSLCALAVSISLSAQDTYQSIFQDVPGGGQIQALAGVTRIGDETYAGIRLQPELEFGKVGLGLNVPLLFNTQTGDLRTEEFKNGAGPLKLLGYARYGKKKDDAIYLKVGDLTGTYLGFGGLVNNYSNSVSFERRKIGLEFDILVKKMFGLEAFYSDFNFASLNILGLRPYVRPFGKTSIPIIKTTEIGLTYVTDRDQTLSQYNDASGIVTQSDFLNKPFNAIGFDIGFTVVNTKILRLTTFVQHSILQENDNLKNEAKNTGDSYGAGNGTSIGALANIKVSGDFLRINSRLERLWYSDNYLPQFFDAIYEINKDGKLGSLISAEKQQGIYGSLAGTFAGKIKLGGALLLPDNLSATAPAYFRLDASADNLAEKFNVRATYMKGGITDLKDAIRIDGTSLLNARLTYNVAKFIVAGVDYRWTFARDENDKVKATSFVTPYFGVNIPL